MALANGVRLGGYEILGLLGAGGMGEVYRARDVKLNRVVALKVLPAQFALDPDRLARFKREAQILASLNHPNIGAIHGLEESESVQGLVLELVEGPTLADRIASGPVPIDEALGVARQIGEALGAAHEQGIVHRDLKPANIKVRDDGTVKVLDFGLAKLAESAGAAQQVHGPMLSVSPTMTSPAMTQIGVILGTAAYMSPEQAKGRPADKRSDIWAFGCVLYEMLTGRRAFDGDDVSDVFAAILRAEADLSRLPADTPPAARKLIQGCLAKDRNLRIADIAVTNFLLKEASTPAVTDSHAAPMANGGRRRVWLTAAGALVVGATLALAATWALNRSEVGDKSVRKFVVPPPQGAQFGQGVGAPAISLSPDDRHLVFVAGGELWIRSFDTVEPRRLPNTRDARAPFWSPDSQFIGFFAEGKLKKIDASGRSVQILCDVPFGLGGTWNREGVILFGRGAEDALYRVSAAGGQPAAATKLDAARGDLAHRWPAFLPDGRRFVYVVTTAKGSVMMLGSLDSFESRNLGATDSKADVSRAGYLLFARQGTLFAQPFDLRRAEISGDAVPIADGIRTNPSNTAAALAVSERILAFRSGGINAGELWWYDRAGKPIGRLAEAAPFLQHVLSPDGKQVAAQIGQARTTEIWLIDVARGVPSKFNEAAGPVWSPDSRSLAFYAQRRGNEIARRQLGSTADEPFAAGVVGIVEDWSMDGRWLLYLASGDVWALSVAGDAKPIRITATDVSEDEPQFAPDGRSIAYMSPESGNPEIYVQPFPGPGERKRVSTSGGVQPKWKRDGRELYYLTPNGTLMAVDMNGATLEPAIPRPLFQTRLTPSNITDQYAVTADGQRFLVLTPVGDASESPIIVVFNWTAALKN